MNKIIRILNKEFGNMNQAALLLGLFTLFSQILGLVRDRFIAHFIGPSASLDAYYAAFRIPDFIFTSIATLVSITVIIPFILERMKDGKVSEEATKFISEVFTVFLVAISVISFIVFLFLPQIVHIVAPGFAPLYQAKVILLSRIMLLSPIFLGLSNLFGTITQLFHRFFIYSLSPIFYNLGIIFGVIVLYPRFGITGLAIGVVIGAVMHFLIQAIASTTLGFRPHLTAKIDFANIKRVVLISLPRTLGLTANNLALIAIVSFASYLKAGSISIFSFSNNLQGVPQGVIGISYAVAAFPLLAKSFSKENMSTFNSHLKRAARQIIFWSLPITFLFMVLRAQIVRVVLGSGSFSWDNTRLVAAAVAIFSVSILAQGMVGLLSRAYYASGNTKSPLVINVLCSISIIFITPVLLHAFEHVLFFRDFVESLLRVTGIPGTEVLMLPLAYSTGTFINFILHWIFIKRDFMRGEHFIRKSFFQSLGASFFIGLVSYVALSFFSPIFGLTTFWGVFLQGFISGILGILAGVLVLYLLKNEELHELIDALKTKFWRSKIIALPPEEL